MKKIDAHSHIGTFGGWAGFSLSKEELISQMKEYEIEKQFYVLPTASTMKTFWRLLPLIRTRFSPWFTSIQKTEKKKSKRYITM